ncbi:hypothetical protein ACFPVS_00305 [Neisseria weixii]|uniref:Uncharacterized protein n=1 Tax=Neisseria weixii TaxID=1853276 RepID=A0A3N4MR39_9NEIS|nr:hypothetical protein [Neisseria weixii]RPD84227.1 hypothetical protein EGK74_11175 [Neisseria weixii]RPD84875.1 hypothetical protein EGK75_11255 [Neisseria weixii]
MGNFGSYRFIHAKYLCGFFIFIGMVFIMPAFYRLLMEIEAVKAIGRFAVPFFSLLATIGISALFTLFVIKLHEKSERFHQ